MPKRHHCPLRKGSKGNGGPKKRPICTKHQTVCDAHKKNHLQMETCKACGTKLRLGKK